MSKKTTQEEFIERARVKHGSFYDYSKVFYINSRTKIRIVCPVHGEFFQPPFRHLGGAGCMSCAVKKRSENKRFTQEEFIDRAEAVHGRGYDYSKVVYKGTMAKVNIVCHIHGGFFQTPGNHLSGQGCPQCGVLKNADKKRLTTEAFIERAISVHGGKYDYSKVDYGLSTVKVCIICHSHGQFFQTPASHMGGNGCPLCGAKSTVDKCRHTTDVFIQRARSVHGGVYDYSKVDYEDARTKVCITCPVHGDFFQVPDKHLSGHRCPHCTGSKGEAAITKWLRKREIPFHYHYLCRDLKVGGQRPPHFDFCTKFLKFMIEYDGEQHFSPVRFNNISEERAIEVFKKVQYRDSLKNQYCIKNNINLLRISYKEFDHIQDILSGKLQSGAYCSKLFVNEMTPEELAGYYTGNALPGRSL